MTTRDEALGFAKQLKAAGVNLSAYPGWEPESNMFLKASTMINELTTLLENLLNFLPKEKKEVKRELSPRPPIERNAEVCKDEKEKKGSPLARAREDEVAFAQSFWDAYPKGHKYARKKCFIKLINRYCMADDPEAFAKKVLEGLEKWKKCERWKDGIIVMAETFINQERWNDEPPPPDPKPTKDLAVSQTANTHANGKVAW